MSKHTGRKEAVSEPSGFSRSTREKAPVSLRFAIFLGWLGVAVQAGQVFVSCHMTNFPVVEACCLEHCHARSPDAVIRVLLRKTSCFRYAREHCLQDHVTKRTLCELGVFAVMSHAWLRSLKQALDGGGTFAERQLESDSLSSLQFRIPGRPVHHGSSSTGSRWQASRIRCRRRLTERLYP